MAKGKGEVVAVVREWKPEHDDSLTKIHGSIDAWGRASEQPPQREHAQVAAAVDRITKRVKTRNVTVQETVTEYVDEDDTVQVAPVAQPTASHSGKPAKRGWFSRRKQHPEQSAPSQASTSPVTRRAPPVRPVATDDAWAPPAGRAIQSPKPLQSKAARKSRATSSRRRSPSKKSGRKKR